MAHEGSRLVSRCRPKQGRVSLELRTWELIELIGRRTSTSLSLMISPVDDWPDAGIVSDSGSHYSREVAYELVGRTHNARPLQQLG